MKSITRTLTVALLALGPLPCPAIGQSAAVSSTARTAPLAADAPSTVAVFVPAPAGRGVTVAATSGAVAAGRAVAVDFPETIDLPEAKELSQALAEVEQSIDAVATVAVENNRRTARDQRVKAGTALELAQATAAAPAGGAIAATAPVAPGPALQQRLQRIVSRGHGGGRILVVRSSDTEPKAQANLEEDLAVMTRILEKKMQEKLSDDRRHRPMGIDVMFVPGSNPIRSLYLEDYGALFVLGVNFPLLPPPEKGEAAHEKPDTDSTWEEAKREIYGASDAWSRFDKGFKFSTGAGPETEYDEHRVADLKDGLFEALKNAGNIRNLKPDETVTVCVTGGAGAASRKARVDLKRSGNSDDDGEAVVVWGHDDGAAARGTVLTIRAKKSDIDAYAQGKMSPEEFRKKASVAAYAGDAGGWGGGNVFGWVSP